MMKKLLLLFAAAGLAALTLCDPESGEEPTGYKQIELTDQSDKNQTAFADEQTSGSVSFTAKSGWIASAV